MAQSVRAYYLVLLLNRLKGTSQGDFADCWSKLESLSIYDGDGNKTMTCTCVLHFGIFLCRSLQNNNAK